MNVLRKSSIAALLLVLAVPAFGGGLACPEGGNVEELSYAWRLRGGVRFLAGLVFPTSGVGNLKTTFGDQIHSELLITAPNGRTGGFYAYESDMDQAGAKTLMTYHGYEWGKKSRAERTIFDYVKGLARIRKQTPEEVEFRVRKLPSGERQFRDVLTAIHFLRRNAATIKAPILTSIYSDGKEYPVVFKPTDRRTFVFEGRTATARAFEIVDAPGGKKWPGGVTVWLSDDERRIPLRIEIEQSFASLQLDLKRIDSCAMIAGL